VVDDRGDHLVIRTPGNPGFHWGNCVFVTDQDAVDEAGRWAATFEACFPEATWTAIGLMQMPVNQRAWTELGFALELDEVLTTNVQPALTDVPTGYVVRRLAGSDWEQCVARAVADNARTGEEEPLSYRRFAEAQVRARRELSASDSGAFFGAFAGDTLVADLGIVRCGSTARYQSVVTDLDHRGRGLAGHLLSVAALWAAEHCCDRWVIVTEASNPAGRVYRRAGFEPDSASVQAYRAPS
jgi:GNAT superfamily N-acetyltransferase